MSDIKNQMADGASVYGDRLCEPPKAMTAKPELPPEYVPASCGGEKCSLCGKPAHRKVGEEIFDDDPQPIRHNLTAYVCYKHFTRIMDRGGYTRTEAPATRSEDAFQQDPILLEVLNFIELCRSLEFVCTGDRTKDAAMERESIKDTADELYKKLDSIKWGVKAPTPTLTERIEGLRVEVAAVYGADARVPSADHLTTKAWNAALDAVLEVMGDA